MKRTPNIRKVSTKKARRNRECWRCGEKILKGSNYVNVEERYDKTIITFSYHESCYNYMLFKAPLNICCKYIRTCDCDSPTPKENVLDADIEYNKPCPECGEELKEKMKYKIGEWSGVKCTKCNYRFCY